MCTTATITIPLFSHAQFESLRIDLTGVSKPKINLLIAFFVYFLTLYYILKIFTGLRIHDSFCNSKKSVNKCIAHFGCATKNKSIP